MAKKINKKQAISKPNEQIKDQNTQSINPKGFWANSRLHKIVIFCFAFLLYANTLKHDYTQDDAIVIYDNMFTTEGISGIPGLLTKDTFFGFFKVEGKANLVSGGRYRPLTPIMFAIEWQLFGNNPFIGHLISVIFYGLLCVLLYKLLEKLFLEKGAKKYSRFFIFLACLFYAAHPIHTEVVANIKGRDEIMCLIGALAAFYYSLKYVDTQKIKFAFIAALSFFLGVMSKENAITFLAIIPLGIYFFRKSTISESLKSLLPLIVATLVFLVIRTSVLGLDFGGAPKELMNNPYLKLSGNNYIPFDFGEKMATIIFTLGKYIQLLVFPHPLTHDYYPRHIDIMHFSDWQVILSMIVYLILGIATLFFWKKNKLISFSIFFFIATLSIVSNIVFPIGTNMSERFMFMPSIGFCLLFAYLFEKLRGLKLSNAMVLGFAMIPLLGFTVKTITRNIVWKSDYSLFTTDVHTSKNSAKMLNAAGGAISNEVFTMEDGPEKTKELEKAVVYLKKAIQIHPRYKNAYLLLGNTHNYLKKYPESIKYYENALQLDNGYDEAFKNLTITLREAGRHYGEKLGNLEQAEKYLNRSYSMDKNNYETLRLLGITNGIQNKHKNAIKYFQEAIDMKPENPKVLAVAYSSLGTAYRNFGDEEMARISFQKAIDLDPNVLNNLQK